MDKQASMPEMLACSDTWLRGSRFLACYLLAVTLQVSSSGYPMNELGIRILPQVKHIVKSGSFSQYKNGGLHASLNSHPPALWRRRETKVAEGVTHGVSGLQHLSLHVPGWL